MSLADTESPECPPIADSVEKVRCHCPNRKCVGCGRKFLLHIGFNSKLYSPIVRYENQISTRACSTETSKTSKIVFQQYLPKTDIGMGAARVH